MSLARTAALLCTLCFIGCDKKADPPAPPNVAAAQPKSTGEAQAAAAAASSVEAAKREAAAKLATARSQVKFQGINFIDYGGENLCETLKLPPQWVACRSAAKDGHPGDADACALVAGANGCKPEPQKQVTWCCPLGKL